MPMKSLDDLFVHFLRDMYYAEKQILKNLPKMARKAEAPELREALEHHHGETEQHVQNLEQVFEILDLKPRGVTCDAIEGILSEARDIMSETEDNNARDAGMIAAAQAVEHYEITRYGTMVAWAKQLGMDGAAKLIQQNLEQEYAADEKLTSLAESTLNRQAA
jgi:ferritin-like metal-binding protein YciE